MKSSRPHLWFAPPAIVLAFSLAACGSTVQTRSVSLPAAGNGLAVGAGSGSDLSAPSGATEASGEPLAGDYVAGAQPGTAGAQPGTIATETAAPPSVGEPSIHYAPGITATEIYVGVLHKINSYNAETGRASNSDVPGPLEILIADLNKKGGVAGRRIVPVLHNVDESNPNRSAVTEEQAKCATWTQDHNVFAVFGQGESSGILLSCLARKHVLFLGGQLSVYDAGAFTTNPYYVLTSGIDMTSAQRPYIDGLVAQRFLTPSSRIGMVTFDTPAHGRMLAQGLKPALAAHGLKTTDVAQVKYPAAMSETTEMASQISAAVLKFRSNNIDRVLFQDTAALLGVLFMNAAESQHYSPLYGLNSQSAPGILVNGGPSGAPLVPLSQLAGSRTVGWLPITDLNEGAVYPSGLASCLTTLRKQTGTRDEKSFGAEACTQLRVLAAAVTAAGRELTPDTFMKGLEQLGGTFTNGATTYRTRFEPGRHYAVAAMRYGKFDAACACYRYATSSAVTL